MEPWFAALARPTAAVLSARPCLATTPSTLSQTDGIVPDLEVTGVKVLDPAGSTWTTRTVSDGGLLLGGLFAMCAELCFDVMVVLNRAATSPTWTFPQRLSFGLTVALLVAGFLCGLAAPATERYGG